MDDSPPSNQDTLTTTLSRTETFLNAACIAAVLYVLYLVSTWNFLLFHGIVELATIAVAFSIFIIIWNIRKTVPDAFFLIIGISFLFTGGIDLVHTLAYKGMGVFPAHDADLPTQLWIAARFFQSITFFAATLFIGKSITRDRKYDTGIIIAACTASCAFLFASIFVWQDFPPCFIEGTGLTPFKIASEYLISFILLITVGMLYLKREHFGSPVWESLVAAQVFLILGELSFTSYVSVYGFTNMLGHLFRLLSVYLFYRVFVVVTLQQPYDRLRAAYEKITASEEELRQNYDEIAGTQKALVESEKKFRETVRLLDEGYYRCTLDGVLLEHNVAFNHILGIDPERDMKGALLPDFWQDPESRRKYLEELQENGFVRNLTIEAKTMTGNPVTLLASAHLVKSDAGHVLGIEGIFTDVTGIRLVKKELHDEQQFTSLLLESFPTFYVAIGTDGRIITMNRALLEALEYSEDEVRGKDYLTMVVPAGDRENLRRVFEEIIREGKSNVNVNRITSRSGKVYLVEWHGRPVKQREGKPGFFVGVGIDITESKVQEHILKAQLDLGQKLQKIHGIHETLEACLDAGIGISDLDSGGIYLLDEEHSSVDLVLAKNLSDEFVASVSHYPKTSVNAQMILAGKPAYLTFTNIRGVIHSETQDREGLRALALLPIQSGGKVIGSLNVSSHIHDEIPPSSRIALESITTQIGTAIERIRAEEALRESGKRLQEAQEMAHLGFWTWDVKTGEVEWSDEVFRIFGLDQKEFTPQIDSIMALSPWPEDHQRDKELIQKAINSREPGEYEQRFLRPDKSTGYYYSTFQGRYDDGGSLISIIGTVLDITERKRAEEALRDSRQILEGILNTIPVRVFWKDKDLVYLGCNTPFVHDAGFEKPGEVIGRDDYAMGWRNQADLYRADDRAVIESGKPKLMIEEPQTTPSGETRYLLTSKLPLLDARGNAIGVLGTYLDITERKRVEDALHQSEELLRLFIRHAPASLAMFDKEMRYIAASRRWMADYHLGDEDIVGRSHYEVFPEIPEEVKALHRRGLAGEVLSSDEDKFIREDGSVQWLAWEMRPWYMAANVIGGIIILSEDITERRRAEAIRERLAAIVEFSDEAIISKTLDGTITSWNAGAGRIYGYSAGEVVGRNISLLVPPGHPDDSRKILDQIANGMPVVRFETLRRKKDGELLNVMLTVSPVRDARNRVTGASTIAHDITERKRAEDLQKKLIAELEQKNAELERFTYTVSHDLKSPLITIKGFAGMVEEDARKGDMPRLEKDVRRITDAAEIMQALLSELLQLSRVGKIINPPQPVPFASVVNEAVELLTVPLAERGVRVEIAPDLPVVNVDRARIREVLVNLIENAIKFFGSQPDPVIRIGVDRSGTEPVFFVEDNGMGINPRYLDRVFNLFERLNVTVYGTGIGLPIARRIIEVHGGKIWAESEGEGRGTTFRFTLPVADARPEKRD